MKQKNKPAKNGLNRKKVTIVLSENIYKSLKDEADIRGMMIGRLLEKILTESFKEDEKL